MAELYIPKTKKGIEGLGAFANEMLESLSTPEVRKAIRLYKQDKEKARKTFPQFADYFDILDKEVI